MATFYPAAERLNSLLLQGLGTPNTPAFTQRLQKILKLIQKPGLIRPISCPTWLSLTTSEDLPVLIGNLPQQALFSETQQTLLHQSPQNENDFERWWIAFHCFNQDLKNLKDNQGQNALYSCCLFQGNHDKSSKIFAQKHMQRAQALIEADVDLFACSQNNQTPLEYWMKHMMNPVYFNEASWNIFQPFILNLVKKHGFKKLMPHFWNQDKISQMIEHPENIDVFLDIKIKRLLSIGYPVNRQTQGRTLLHLAVEKNSPTLAFLFLSYGAKNKSKNKKGWTPMQLLKRLHPKEVGSESWIFFEQEYLQENLPEAKNSNQACLQKRL